MLWLQQVRAGQLTAPRAALPALPILPTGPPLETWKVKEDITVREIRKSLTVGTSYCPFWTVGRWVNVEIGKVNSTRVEVGGLTGPRCVTVGSPVLTGEDPQTRCGFKQP